MNEFQQAELKILKEIIKVCEANDLTYFAIGGTCLGAIRHQGFIPWDDDIDIAMPRNDYEHFRTYLHKELPSHLQLLDYDNTESNNFLFSKIHDIRTTMIDSYAKDDPARYTGVFVDVMPVDGLPDDKKEAVNILKKYNNIIRKNNVIRGSNNKKIFSFAKKVMRLFHRYNYFTTELCSIASHYTYSNTRYISFTWRPEKDLGLQRVLFEYDDFSSLIETPFEDIMIRIPSGFDHYLTQDFGEYMSLPPLDKRNSGHERYIYDISRPFEYYVEMKRGELK